MFWINQSVELGWTQWVFTKSDGRFVWLQRRLSLLLSGWILSPQCCLFAQVLVYAATAAFWKAFISMSGRLKNMDVVVTTYHQQDSHFVAKTNHQMHLYMWVRVKFVDDCSPYSDFHVLKIHWICWTSNARLETLLLLALVIVVTYLGIIPFYDCVFYWVITPPGAPSSLHND